MNNNNKKTVAELAMHSENLPPIIKNTHTTLKLFIVALFVITK
jgi:hypothetical protein